MLYTSGDGGDEVVVAAGPRLVAFLGIERVGLLDPGPG
jgi:hypothetical protein